MKAIGLFSALLLLQASLGHAQSQHASFSSRLPQGMSKCSALALFVYSDAKHPCLDEPSATLNDADGSILSTENTIVDYVNWHGCGVDKTGDKFPLTTKQFAAVAITVANQTDVYVTTLGVLAQIRGGAAGAGGMGLPKEQKAALGNAAGGVTFPGSPHHNLVLLTPQTLDNARLAHELLHIILRQFGNTTLAGGEELADYSAAANPAMDLHHQLLLTIGFASPRETTLAPWQDPGGSPAACGSSDPGKTASNDGPSPASGDGASPDSSGGSNANPLSPAPPPASAPAPSSDGPPPPPPGYAS